MMLRLVAVACALLTTLVAPAHATDYPAKPIRLIASFPPGGVVDRVARIVSDKLKDLLGRPVIVDNRGGASGILGTAIVAKSAPDGYTILFTFSSHTINPSLSQAPLPFDTKRDLTAVAKLVDTPQILVAHPSLPADTLPDLIKHAKAKPGTLSYASVGVGTPGHLAGQLFAKHAGISLLHVPYKGAGPATPDVLAGRVPLFFVSFPTGWAYVPTGELKALAVTSTSRMEVAPHVPTMVEAGMRDFRVSAWVGAFAPAKTPQPIVDKLSRSLAQILEMPDVRDKLNESGALPAYLPPRDFAQEVATEIRFWARFVQEADIQKE